MEFTQLNLLQPSYPFSAEFDVIFFRNVMIYFNRETQQTLIEKMGPHLLSGGYLMIGHSETLSGMRHGLEVIEPAVYRKK